MRHMLKAERRAKKKVVQRKFKKLCQGCGERPALYTVRIMSTRTGGTKVRKKASRKTRFNKDHDLCKQCRRSLKDSVHSRLHNQRDWSVWQGGRSW